ncbi:SDR family NAD(P)-dependent oxidoreductase, partial [Candidatus Omnitrophota bacterium]
MTQPSSCASDDDNPIAAFRPLPFLASYSASKAALSAFTDSLRAELYNHKIDIINVYLGKVDTSFSRQPEIVGGGKNKDISGPGMSPEKAALLAN